MDREFMMRAQRQGGLDCPTCGKFTKVYKRRLNSGVIYQVYRAWRKHGTEPFDRPVSFPDADNANMCLAKHWGLVEHRVDLDGPRDAATAKKKKDTTRMWQVTAAGVVFLNNELKVKPRAYVYDNRLIKRVGRKTYVSQLFAIGPFDYEELMQDLTITTTDEEREALWHRLRQFDDGGVMEVQEVGHAG